ncbi:MAG TPA: MFS transporter, partial [Clostridiales bacterium]|nr:MFS transporter [Clostridiales bacterium]
GAYLLCCKLTTERFIVPQKTDKFDFRNLVKGWFSNKPLMGIILSTFFMLTSQNIMSGLTAYVFPNYFRNPAAQSIATIVAALPLFILAPFMTKLSIKVGRKKLGIIGLSIGIVAFLIAFFIKTTNLWLFIILYGFGNCGVFIIGLICWAMITDVIDDMEVQNGVREDGNVYSVYSFSRKMGQALGTGAAGWTLTVIGYTAKTQFDPNVTQGIYNGICLLPAIFFTLSLLALIFLYPLTRERVENNAKVLADRREQAKEAEIQAEDLGLEEAAKVEDPTVNKVEQPSSDLK